MSHAGYLKYRVSYFPKPFFPKLFSMLYLIFTPTDFCEKSDYFHLLRKIFLVSHFGQSGIRISTDTPDTYAILWMDLEKMSTNWLLVCAQRLTDTSAYSFCYHGKFTALLLPQQHNDKKHNRHNICSTICLIPCLSYTV